MMNKEKINNQVNKQINRLSKELGLCKRSFSLYDGHLELIAPNIQGKENAEKNVNSINYYSAFFTTAIHCSLLTTLITLSKIFVYDDGAIGIEKTLNLIYNNLNRLNTTELVKKTDGFKKVDIIRCQDLIKTHKKDIENLKIIRNKYLAHLDPQISPKDLPEITNGTIENLILIGTEIIKILEDQSGLSASNYNENQVSIDFSVVINLINKTLT